MAEEFSLTHASTGAIFREAVSEGSELGETVESYLDSGKLVPDELTCRVVKEMVLRREESYILDGFPRTLPQAEMLDQMLRDRDEELDAALLFQLSDEEAVRRLTGRLVCKNCGKNYHREFMPPREEGTCDECGGDLKVRSDSSEEIVRERLREYEEKTKPLVPFYENRNILKRVDASQAPDAVSADTRKVLQELEA